MAEYGTSVIICNSEDKRFEGNMAILNVQVRKANPKHRLVRFRAARIYLDLLELDYVRQPNGIPDINQEIRRNKLTLSMEPGELFALADYVKSQLATTPPAPPEDAVSVEAPDDAVTE